MNSLKLDLSDFSPGISLSGLRLDCGLSYDLAVSQLLGFDAERVRIKAKKTSERQFSRMVNLGLPSPDITPTEMIRLWNACGWYCLYSGQRCVLSKEQHPLIMTLDHLVPLRYGSPTSVSNLIPSSLGYNGLKKDDDIDTFLFRMRVDPVVFERRRKQMVKNFAIMTHQSFLWSCLQESLDLDCS